MDSELTPRQREILRQVVQEHVATGRPVGSKSLVERAGMQVSPSTVRNELAELEARGLLAHPHTSAGRVPTEHGYRYYADEVLGELEPRPARFPLDLGEARREVESALQSTTEVLAELTRLLALVSAPPLQATVVRHVEVLLLQPRVVMAVVITSAGGVSKRSFAFAEPIDAGLATWAREYLNERLEGVQLGTHLFRQRLHADDLSPREGAFIEAIRPVFSDAAAGQEQRLFVGGAASLLDEARGEELVACHRLLGMLEKRAALLGVIGEALEPRRMFVRVGEELDSHLLRDVSLVASTYGLANRTLGAVSLLGPVRMDYGNAIRSVRAAAFELSRFVEEVYEDN